jgi:hypothetical protein
MKFLQQIRDKFKKKDEEDNLQELLLKDYEKIKEESVEINDLKDYQKQISLQNELVNKIVDLEKIRTDEKIEKRKHIITIITFTVTTAVSIYMANKTFKFDQSDSITSTLGKNILNNFIPKNK